MPDTLLFVYNADAGLVNGLLDLLHKTLSPGTYACSLCALTYGASMRPEWKEFLESLPVDVRFLHRDEFLTELPDLQATALPAVFRQGATVSGWQPFITAAELKATDLAGLMALVRTRLASPPAL